jgi:hypothetical protein
MHRLRNLADAINERVIRIQSHFDGGRDLTANEVQNLQRQIGQNLAEICRRHNDIWNRLNAEAGRADQAEQNANELGQRCETRKRFCERLDDLYQRKTRESDGLRRLYFDERELKRRGEENAALMKSHGVTIRVAGTYSHRSQSLVERFNRTLGERLYRIQAAADLLLPLSERCTSGW